MANLLNIHHADMLKGESLPGVDDRSVKVLFPVVISGQLLGKGEMEKGEEVCQLKIGIAGFRLSVNLSHIAIWYVWCGCEVLRGR